MKKTYIFLGIIIVIVAVTGYFAWQAGNSETPGTNPEPVATSTTATSTATTTPPTTSGDLILGVGKTGAVGALNLTFNKLVQDSRCPIDVQCIQAGSVTVNVTMTDGVKSETKNMASDEVPYVFNRYYKISISDVSPNRKSQVEIPARDYVITFHVEKSTVAIPPPVVQGVVMGIVTLSPTCPVERNPPDPNCAPKPYQTTVTILGVTSGKTIATTQTKTDGTFMVTIPFGDYIARATGAAVYPRCQDTNFTLQGANQAISISCDTGIR